MPSKPSGVAQLPGGHGVGLYIVARTRAVPPRRGALVLACLPRPVARLAKARGYVPQGGPCPEGLLPVGKAVAAVGGDVVAVTPAGLVVNGSAVPNSLALRADRQGRLLPRLPWGRYVVRAGEVWLVSSYSRASFDSRYFGPISTGGLVAGLEPL